MKKMILSAFVILLAQSALALPKPVEAPHATASRESNVETVAERIRRVHGDLSKDPGLKAAVGKVVDKATSLSEGKASSLDLHKLLSADEGVSSNVVLTKFLELTDIIENKKSTFNAQQVSQAKKELKLLSDAGEAVGRGLIRNEGETPEAYKARIAKEITTAIDFAPKMAKIAELTSPAAKACANVFEMSLLTLSPSAAVDAAVVELKKTKKDATREMLETCSI